LNDTIHFLTHSVHIEKDAQFNAHKPPIIFKKDYDERGYLGNYQRYRIEISDLDSVDLSAAQVS